MKKQFKKCKTRYWSKWNNQWCDWPRAANRYQHRYAKYFRHIKTYNEIRKNSHATADGYKVRGKRNHLPTVNDDPYVGRNWKKSWKDFTKAKKQYMKNY